MSAIPQREISFDNVWFQMESSRIEALKECDKFAQGEYHIQDANTNISNFVRRYLINLRTIMTVIPGLESYEENIGDCFEKLYSGDHTNFEWLLNDTGFFQECVNVRIAIGRFFEQNARGCAGCADCDAESKME